jgi:hypothetical protein
MPTRFEFRRGVKGFKSPPGGKVVTRSSRFGNPFKIDHGRRTDPAAHAEAVAKFREWITSPEQAELLGEARRELRGRDLVCSFPLGLPCHADVLLELVNDE